MAASRVACASFNIGTNTTITITRDNNNYTHTITYKFGSATGTIATKTTSTSVVWSPTASTLYAQIPDAVSGYGTVTCQTYNGNTLIGTTTAGFYAYAVKSECLPTVTATVVDTNSSTIALTGSNTNFVRWISKPKVTVTATPKNGTTINSINIDMLGQYATSSPYTFNEIYDNYYYVTATDKRGYSTRIKPTIENFVEYDPCYFTSITLKRTESTSTTAKLNLKGYCFKGSFGTTSNTLTVKYRYKTTGNYGSYVNVAATWNSDGTFTATASVPNLALASQYTFEVIAQDKLTSFGDGEEIFLGQGTGDLRIGTDYVQTKNDLIIGGVTNTVWKGVKARRKISNVSYSSLFGIGNVAGSPTASIELKNANNINLGRYDLRSDGHLYNYLTSMSVAELEAFAPSIVAGGSQGRLLLNGGNANPILLQWGRVSVTPAADTIKKQQVNFLYQFQGLPIVKTEASTGAPASVDVNAGDITATGFNIYLQRPTATATSIMWFAIGNGTQALPE